MNQFIQWVIGFSIMVGGLSAIVLGLVAVVEGFAGTQVREKCGCNHKHHPTETRKP